MNPSPRVEGLSWRQELLDRALGDNGAPKHPMGLPHWGQTAGPVGDDPGLVEGVFFPQQTGRGFPRVRGFGCVGYAPPSSWIAPQPKKVRATENQGLRDPKIVPVE